MNLSGLAKKSLIFFWRTNLGVLLAVIVSTAVLVGALVVGDSVRYSLRRMVTLRLGSTQYALVPQGRFFRAGLADDLTKELDTAVAPVLQLRGVISDGSGVKRANRIEVLGVEQNFFDIGEAQNPFAQNPDNGVVLNGPLAAQLGVATGDEIVLRIEKPSLMPRDIPISPDSDIFTAFRLPVIAVAKETDFGLFGLQANQVAPFNVFVPLQWLQEKIARNGQANMLLVPVNVDKPLTVETVNQTIDKCLKAADVELEFQRLDKPNVIQIRSRRVFIDEPVAEAAMAVDNKSEGILTYFMNELSLGEKSTPYSMVAAVGPQANTGGIIIPADMNDDEIVINQWLADDLEAKVGDSIELTYFILGMTRKLQEQSGSFRVRQILPMKGPAVDPNLMPDYPGLADADNCRDWDSGIPIDFDKVRDKDEKYWDTYRGTPKAFVTLSAGRSMWANRYGNLTAVRYPTDSWSIENIASNIMNKIDPASLGFFFQPVREQGLKAGSGSTDFGQLFLGLSMFLIISALILVGLLFVFGVESRSEQIGLLLAVGFSSRLVRRLLFIEGGILAIIGAAVGTAAAIFYTRAMIYGLATVWNSAIGGSTVHFYAKSATLVGGGLASVFICLFAIWLTLRRQASRPARELLSGGIREQFFTDGGKTVKHKVGFWISIAAAIGAVVLIFTVGKGSSSAVSGAFFGAGALLLISGVGLTRTLLGILSGSNARKSAVSSLAALGLRNATRRTGRSLAVVGLLACGIFLVIAVGANRRNPLANARNRDSGTGGFALYGESAVDILYDLNSEAGRKSMSLEDPVLNGVEFVQLRVHDGDDASCLNLNRAQRPRLLGVRPYQFQARGAFRFADIIGDSEKEKAWDLLDRDFGENVVPAIGDYATVIWALGKKIGDDIDYTDEKGRHFKLRLVGMLDNTIMQGSLIISEDRFIKRFPSEEGYRVFLIDTSQEMTEKVAEKLSFVLSDYGLTLTTTAKRLAAFNAVESTYLSIFQLLGGLGLILGSMGLGLVVLRNVLDRRGELAMMRAVGFNKSALKKMVFQEHTGLMVSGLICGIVSAVIAVSPALKSPGARIPYLSLILTILVIGISGLIWIWAAAAIALRGEMLDVLRNE